MTTTDVDPDDIREASEEETNLWLAGEIVVSGAIETDHGLLLPRQSCACGEEIFYDSRTDPRLHRRCNQIP